MVNSFTVPGLRTRKVDTGVEMQAGQTLALAGLLQERVEMENKGIPWISDVPFVGAAFRRVREEINEIELLILVTPEIVDAMDPHQVPPCGPGQGTTSPDDIELYGKGYHEVPRCCADGTCAACQGEFSGADSYTNQNGGTQESPHQRVAPVETPTQPLPPSAPPVRDLSAELPPTTPQYGQFNDLTQAPVPNPQNRYKVPSVPKIYGNPGSSFEPTLIGPVGYELHE